MLFLTTHVSGKQIKNNRKQEQAQELKHNKINKIIVYFIFNTSTDINLRASVSMRNTIITELKYSILTKLKEEGLLELNCRLKADFSNGFCWLTKSSLHSGEVCKRKRILNEAMQTAHTACVYTLFLVTHLWYSYRIVNFSP